MISNTPKIFILVLTMFLLLPSLLFSGDTQRTAFLSSIQTKNTENIYTLNIKGVNYTTRINFETIRVSQGRDLLSEYDISVYGQNIFSSAPCDINNDKSDELILLLKQDGLEYGDILIILSYDGSFHEIYNKSLISLNPWKVQACDADGDGQYEISLGVYTKSAFHGDWAKRPFIYNYINDELQPKWLGSRLSRPFDDYIFCDVDKDGMDELVSIERLNDGRKEITAYRWKGFGFEGIGNTTAFDDISVMKPEDNAIVASVFENNKWSVKAFKYQEGKLVE